MNKNILLIIEGAGAAGAAVISSLEFFTPVLNFAAASIGLFLALKGLHNYKKQSKK